jgi:hypothetical protein
MKMPEWEDFCSGGECPDCGDLDPHPGVYYAGCCGRSFCWDCYWRKHEKYEVKDAAAIRSND